MGLTCSQCFAQDAGGGEPEFNRRGTYLAVGGAIGFQTRASDELNRQLGTANLEIGSAAGFNGRIGARGRIFGAELEFEYFPAFKVVGSVPPDTVDTYDMLAATANLRVHYPGGRAEPFLLFGVGYSRVVAESMQGSRDTADVAVRGGAGLNWYFTEHIAFSVDTTYVWTGARDNEFLDYVSISYGLTYKF